MTKPAEMKACPMCGPDMSIVECYLDDNGKWRVACGACGLHSGFRPDNDREKLIEHWNARPCEAPATPVPEAPLYRFRAHTCFCGYEWNSLTILGESDVHLNEEEPLPRCPRCWKEALTTKPAKTTVEVSIEPIRETGFFSERRRPSRVKYRVCVEGVCVTEDFLSGAKSLALELFGCPDKALKLKRWFDENKEELGETDVESA